MEQIAYAIVNPVAAGLIYEPEDWPGLTASANDLGRRALEGRRPSFYFRDDELWPRKASRLLAIPEPLRVLGDDEEIRRRIDVEVQHQKQRARAAVKARGWKVTGAIAARNVSPYRRVHHGAEPFP